MHHFRSHSESRCAQVQGMYHICILYMHMQVQGMYQRAKLATSLSTMPIGYSMAASAATAVPP